MELSLKQLIDDLDKFDSHQVLLEIVEKNQEVIVDLQSEQWLEGRGVDGDFIRPFYSENPYFKTRDAATRYARWKAKITPNPERPFDVPNLYINGYLHGSLFVRFSGDEFEPDSTVSFADDAFSVHANAKGLNAKTRLQFAEQITLPQFAAALLEKTGLVL